MKTITTRLVETADEAAAVYRQRYEYYVVWREMPVPRADHAQHSLSDERDQRARTFATFAGPDVVGSFRMEVGRPHRLGFGADWHYSDFLDVVPDEVGLVSWLITDPHLRDTTVLEHMVKESVAFASELELEHVFFECCPAHWPLFHRAGLKRKGGALRHSATGLMSAVFHLDRSDRKAAAEAAKRFGPPVLIADRSAAIGAREGSDGDPARRRRRTSGGA